jgi:hypothetical protein
VTVRPRTGSALGATTLVGAALLLAPSAAAESPARERELSCSDGTVFVGEQVRMGAGSPPRVWRHVDPGGTPAAFSFHAATVIAPDGTVVESESWDTAFGVAHHQEPVVCGFTIPVGPLAGHTAELTGFFVT